MIITTTESVPNHRIEAFKGIVTGEAVMGTNVVADWFGSIRDFVGGRSGTYQKLLSEAKDQAVADLEARAAERGANAVIGVDLDYQVIGGDAKTMLIVVASGTAVVVG